MEVDLGTCSLGFGGLVGKSLHCKQFHRGDLAWDAGKRPSSGVTEGPGGVSSSGDPWEFPSFFHRLLLAA